MVVLRSKSENVPAEQDACVVLGLLVILEGSLRCEKVGADVHLVADAHQDRLPARVKRFRRARATVSVHDEVIKIDISKAEAMDPVPGTIEIGRASCRERG